MSKETKAKSTERNNTAREKRKKWMKEKFKRRKPPPKEKEKEKTKAQQMFPPQDAQQFSANWKALQEVCYQNSITSFCVSYLCVRFCHIHLFVKLSTDIEGQSAGEEAGAARDTQTSTSTSKWRPGKKRGRRRCF